MKDIIKKAKQEYFDAIRGRDYQDVLLQRSNLGNVSKEYLIVRRKIYQTRVCLIEDIFGTKLLQGELDENQRLYK